jgi:hypothetical protein
MVTGEVAATANPGPIDHFGAEACAYFELHDLCFENGTIASVALAYFCFETRVGMSAGAWITHISLMRSFCYSNLYRDVSSHRLFVSYLTTLFKYIVEF